MILDLKANPDDRNRFDVIEKSTGANIGAELAIFYADDDAGLIRYYVEKDGVFQQDPVTRHPIKRAREVDIEIRPRVEP